MSQLTWNAEGGSAGTTITVANSGGASGNAWDLCSIGVGATNQYNAQAANGNLSALLITVANSAQTFNQWRGSIAAIWPTGMVANYGRTYIRINTLPAVDRVFVEMLDSSGITNRGNILIRSTGLLRLRNSANGTVVTGTAALSINTWYRVEWQVNGSTSAAWQLILFLGNSTTPIETLSGSGANFGGAIGTYNFGRGTMPANIDQVFFDDININDVGLPGPFVPAGATQGRWAGVRAAHS